MIKTCTLLLFLLTASTSWAQNADEYETKLAKLKQLIGELQQQLEDVSSAKDELSSELSGSETEIGDLTKRIKQIEQELTQEKKQLALLREQRKKLQTKRQAQAKAVSKQLVSAYKMGNQSQLKALLNLDDTEQLARLIQYHKYIVDARQSKIDEYLSTVHELDQVEPAIIASTAQLSQKQSALLNRQSQLQQANRQRQKTLALLAKRGKSAQQELAKATSERDQLQKLLDEVTSLLAAIPTPADQQPISELRGQLAWPVKGKVKHRFGSQRGGQLKWDGMLIAAPEGTPINALHGGRVVYSDWLPGQGLLIIVDHGNNYLSLYGHNQTLYKEVGDWVGSGETLGLAGSTGGQKESGLYFEIRYKGQPQNPTSWCRG